MKWGRREVGCTPRPVLGELGVLSPPWLYTLARTSLLREVGFLLLVLLPVHVGYLILAGRLSLTTDNNDILPKGYMYTICYKRTCGQMINSIRTILQLLYFLFY